ncbi:MAG: nucleotide-binding universal stress UspA family protein [Mariniblastus sp.]|jgi:nucleotide-binding universal stress UspA family protein
MNNQIQKAERVLVPVDLSERSLGALKIAQQMANNSGAEVHVLNVHQPIVAVVPVGGAAIQSPVGTMSTSETQEQITKRLCEFTQSSGIACDGLKHQVVEGSPATAIVDYAKDNQIDLIAMTTHGKTGLTRLLMGSVAESVVRTAPCPVLTLSDNSKKE